MRLYENLIAAEIERAYPHLTAARCRQLALTLLALAYGSGLLVEIGLDGQQKSVTQFASLLLQTVANQNE